MWSQHYTPIADNLAASALVAALPLFALLYLLGVKRRPSWVASLAGLAATIAVALFAYRMPPGATATLGLAFAATGFLYPFFSALLGWAGVFLTASDTSANALFGNLQAVTAERLGFRPVLMAAANSAGGVMGKMISLQSIAVAAAATGLDRRQESSLFRFTLRHSVLLASLIGLIV